MQTLLSEYLYEPIFNTQIDIIAVILSFVLAALLSGALAFVYRRVNKGDPKNYIMMQSLIILSITIAAAMILVGNELARAFGLVGAVSVIRFRTSVRNYRDMAFVFIAIVIGMAAGLGFYLLGIVFGVLTGLLLLLFSLFHFGEIKKTVYGYSIRIIFGTGGMERNRVEETFTTFGIEYHFLGLKSNRNKNWILYKIMTSDRDVLEKLVGSLRAMFTEKDVSIRIDALKQ